MPRVLLGVLLALTVSPVATGCSRAEDSPRPTRTKNGLTLYEVRSAGFALAVPHSWVTFEPTDVEPEAADEFLRDNPAFEGYGDMWTPDSPIEFLAIAPGPARNGPNTSATVVVLPAPDGYTLDELARTAREEVERLGGTAIEADRVTLPAGEAYLISYRLPYNRDGRSVTVAGRQYDLISAGHVFSLTYTTMPALAARYEGAFTRSAESLRPR
jgi:hypothetical protein